MPDSAIEVKHKVCALLDQAAIPYEVINRANHMLVRVDNQTVATLSRGRTKQTVTRNCLANVRRVIRNRSIAA